MTLRAVENWLTGVNGARLALAMAALTNVFLIFLAADANHSYLMGSQIVLPTVRIIAFFCMICLLTIHLHRDWVKPDAFTILVLGYAAIGTALGLAFGNDRVLLVRHLFASLTIAGFYWLGMGMQRSLAVMLKDVKVWSWVTFAASLALYVILFPRLISAATTSATPTPLLLTLAVGLTSGPVWTAVLATLLIAIGNNRAALLGASVSLAIWIGTSFSTSRVIARIMAVVILVPTLFLAMSFFVIGVNRIILNPITQPGGVPAVLSERLERVLDFLPDDQTSASPQKAAAPKNVLDEYSSFRVLELKSVLNTLKKNALGPFFGSGFGATFEFTYYSEMLNAIQNSVRFQPDVAASYFLLTGGMLGAVVFLLLLHRLFFLSWGALSGAVRGPYVLFVLGYSISNMVGFVPNSPLIWLLMGGLWMQLQEGHRTRRSSFECAGMET
jgi:hypothetical protein